MGSSWPTRPTPGDAERRRDPAPRQVGRVLLLDGEDRLLLLAGSRPEEPGRTAWWFTPGGGAEPGESPAQAARRELAEETGLHLDRLGPAVLERRTAFDFAGVHFDQDEVYFVARAEAFEPDGAGQTEAERRFLVGHRWWTLGELAATSETVYPEGLARLLEEVLGEARGTAS